MNVWISHLVISCVTLFCQCWSLTFISAPRYNICIDMLVICKLRVSERGWRLTSEQKLVADPVAAKGRNSCYLPWAATLSVIILQTSSHKETPFQLFMHVLIFVKSYNIVNCCLYVLILSCQGKWYQLKSLSEF